MTQKRLWISAAIIGLIIVIGFAISIPHTKDETLPPKQMSAATTIPTVTVHDVFKKGTHTITGTVEAPNACTAVAAEASVLGNASTTGNVVQIALVMPTTTGICLQLPTPVKFGVTISAPAQITITATVNGAVASTTSL